MSVVARCPSCGTTTSALGECEACHGAQARYFCTSHAPGIWLDAPRCPLCGARFGEDAVPDGVLASSASVRRAAAARAPAPSVPPGAPSRVSVPPRAPSRPARVERPVPLWPALLRIALARRHPGTEPAAPGVRSLPGAGGCLKRLLLMGILGFLIIVLGVFLFGAALLRGY